MKQINFHKDPVKGYLNSETGENVTGHLIFYIERITWTDEKQETGFFTMPENDKEINDILEKSISVLKQLITHKDKYTFEARFLPFDQETILLWVHWPKDEKYYFKMTENNIFKISSVTNEYICLISYATHIEKCKL